MRFFGVFVVSSALAFFTACSSDVETTPGDGGSGGSGVATGTGSVTHASVTHTAASTSTGIGEPSTTFPAPHDAPPSVVNLGGGVLTTPRIVPIMFASDDPTYRQAITDFTAQIGASDYWHAVTSEYAVGPAVSATPVVVDETIPSVIDDDDVANWIAEKLDNNDPAFPQPDGESIYAIFYPPGVTITLQGDQSCQSFGGYHNDTQLNSGQHIAYAVMPRCGSFGPIQGIDAVTGVASHEYIEAATDPYPNSAPAYGQTDNAHLYWVFALGGGEVGDMCAQFNDVFTTYPGFNFTAQRSWSNASIAAGHDPCVPVPTGETYFAAVPKLPDSIQLGGGFNFKGIKIAEGETKTIDVNLFSDGPTRPFNVNAFDGFGGGGGSLDLELDESQGQNGQTLHLTITVNQASQFKTEVFYLSSELDGRQNLWLGAVGN